MFQSISKDLLISRAQKVLNILANDMHEFRPTPEGLETSSPHDLSPEDKTKSASYMRVNHTGEVCAQALYLGHLMVARDEATAEFMKQAALEEQDHLNWTQERIEELGSRTSLLNPAFFALSFGIGALSGLRGDKHSLAFVEETEKQVVEHLESHKRFIPDEDTKSHAIIQQMQEDEAKHAHGADELGATDMNPLQKKAMHLMGKVMTSLTYRI